MKIKCYVWICMVFFMVSSSLKAQVIKVENGFSLTSLHGELGGGKTGFPYQMAAGVDYFDREWFNLSSQIGYTRKGEKETIYYGHYEESFSEKKSYQLYFGYITFNTTFQAKKKHNKETYYVGIGPRLDIQVSTPENELFKNINTNKILVGLKCETGFNYQLNEDLVLGFNLSYLPTFNKIIKYGDITLLRERTFSFGVSLGYIIN